MVKVGQVAIKIAGRDAGQICAVVEVLDENYVLVDGMTRRRKCNIDHLEFLGKELKIKKGANTKEVLESLKAVGFSIPEVKKGSKKEKKTKPVKFRKSTKKETVEVVDKKAKKK